MVVPISPDDMGPSEAGPLAGIALQRQVEQAAFAVGGEGFAAPGQRLADFVAGRVSDDLPNVSYRPGLVPGDFGEIFPGWMAQGLREGFSNLVRRYPALRHRDAVMVGVESRTSAPLRVPRDRETGCSAVAGLYPCGEGAGFAGGIMSAALDGVRVVDQMVAQLGAPG